MSSYTDRYGLSLPQRRWLLDVYQRQRPCYDEAFRMVWTGTLRYRTAMALAKKGLLSVQRLSEFRFLCKTTDAGQELAQTITGDSQ